MKKVFLTLMVLGFFAAFGAEESYGQITPRSDARQKRQNKRINHGIKNDSLTARETARLNQQQQNISEFENKIKSDGKVTATERARLQHKENKASRNIYRKKHNKRTGN